MRFATLCVVCLTVAAVAAGMPNLLDPSPTLKGLGDTLYTSVSEIAANTAGSGNAGALQAAVSGKAHAVTGALHSAADPIGTLTLAKFHAIDNALYEKRSNGSCNLADKKPQPGAYAFLGSGNLLPFYQGIVQALQDRSVLTPAVLATSKFSGFSGGSLTAVLTGLGWAGSRQFSLYKKIFNAVVVCKANAITPAQQLECTLNGVGIPIIRAELVGTDVPSIINGRVSLWACQVNAMSTTLNGSLAFGTTKWTSNDDVLANIMVSDQIACITTNTFYNIFRGAPYIDGGYCTDYALMCPKDEAKCLKMSTEFLGPNLPAGTPFPTVENCAAYVVPPDFLPNVGKPYYTPGNQSAWTLPRGSCLSATDKAAVNTSPLHVPQGVTARPDIHPAFYAPLPPEFSSGCEWLQTSLVPVEGPNAGQFEAGLDATFAHGYASGAGWANDHGYCA